MGGKIFYQPHDVYHADKRLSKTALDKINRSPAHYQAWLKEEDTPPTPEMIFGAFYHKLALEPGKFHEGYVLIPQDAPDKRTKAGKEWWAAFDERNQGMVYITQEMMDKALGMLAMLRAHSRASRILENAMIEFSVYGTLYGIECKVKPDIMHRGLNILADLKTAVSADYKDFQRAIVNYRYHVQAAYYMDLVEAVEPNTFKQFVFIVQEKNPPYGIMVYRADHEMLRLGRIEYAANLMAYKVCEKANEWPCYPEEVVTISLPAWAR